MKRPASRRSTLSSGTAVVAVMLALAALGTTVAARHSPRTAPASISVPASRDVPAFVIDREPVTAEQYRRCVDAGACDPDAADGAAYCRWKGGRLANQAELAQLSRLVGAASPDRSVGFRCAN